MKNIYLKIFLFSSVILLQSYFSAKLNAQCSCAGGAPPAAIVQSITIPPTTVSSLNFNFQQFNPAVGTLNCVALWDSITGTSYTGARNTGPDSTAFLFLLSLTNKVSGPGISIVHPFSQTYGYDTLKRYGLPGDTITYGPANIITDPVSTANTTGNAAYLGSGTVAINYAINGGMITLDGGSNYRSSVTTTIGGVVKLTYYYCPLALLASTMQNFTAVKKDNTIVLNWNAQNAEAIESYEIEYSINGKDFTSAATVAGDHNAAGNYAYDYALNGNNSGAVYFRIKITNNNNREVYSSVQKISLNEKSGTGVSTRPNPATTGMAINFDRPINGDYSVDLVNLSGQVVLNKKITLTNASTIPLNWSSAKPAPGIYFTRITNTGSMEQQIIRVVIQ